MEQERISPQLVLSILGVEQIMNEPFSIFSDEEVCNAKTKSTH
jgi:hypothetical protein